MLRRAMCGRACALLALLLATACQQAAARRPPTGPATAEAAGAPGVGGGAPPGAAAGGRPHVDTTRLSPALIPLLEHRIAVANGSVSAQAVPPAWTNLLPFSGKPRVLCILIDFPDSPWNVAPNNPANTPQLIKSRMFGASDSFLYPFESVTGFWSRASYGAVNIQGDVTNYVRLPNPRSYYEGVENATGNGAQAVIEDAMDILDQQGFDFMPYDNDGNGWMETVYIKWTGPDNGWSGFWWPSTAWAFKQYVWSWVGSKKDCDLIPAGTCASGSKSLPLYVPVTDIHETGHALGLPDLYDHDDKVGPNGGVGGLDIMDGMQTDLNGFFKWLLGWLTPAVVASGTAPLSLRPMGTAKDAALIFPGAKLASPWSEFFWVEYRKRGVGNDPMSFPNDGLVIWHIDARLTGSPADYAWDNSITAHKLVRLMEADGLEEIEKGVNNGYANAGDIWTAGKNFTPASRPNSYNYANKDSGVYVTGIGAAGASIPVTLSIGPPGATPPTNTTTSDAAALPNQKRAAYHATLLAANGSFVASGALVRADAVLTAGAAGCPTMGCKATFGPASPSSASPTESRTAKTVISHPTANLQLAFLDQCTTTATSVTPATNEAAYSAFKARPWLLTGWQTLQGGKGAASLMYSYTAYNATPCAAALAAAGQFCAGQFNSTASAGPCAGDRGSPLVYNTDAAGTAPAAAGGAADVLAGLSVGSEVCGRAGARAVFTSVARYASWIANNLAARPNPCWTKNATLGTAAVVPVGAPAKQVFAPPPGVVLGAADYKKVEAARAVTQCTEECRLRELYGGGCKAFSIYSAVNTGRRRLQGVLDPPTANWCVFYAAQVPELCGAAVTGHCANAVAAWRMTWTGA